MIQRGDLYNFAPILLFILSLDVKPDEVKALALHGKLFVYEEKRDRRRDLAKQMQIPSP